jgi:hypothetical protein
MIVLDEQLADPRIRREIERWYPGQVRVITEARPHTRVPDEVVDALLHHLKDPTFVTINYTDFWRKIRPHRGYCVICLKLAAEETLSVPEVVRGVLRRPEFSTKRKRLGKIILVSESTATYYD